ncbi:MAG: hypothetical protein IJM85_07050 [Clostridia bacterium]|nr:hypothetical protein [Clostridia bacterium]
MTKALYYDLPTVTECTARVVSCAEKDGRCLVSLDRTPIFPEGGGQLADGGFICFGGRELPILACRTEGEEILHTVPEPLEPGAAVTVRLDLARRLDHSEQHTGEHILSGLASTLFGAVNVGFHMAEDYCTIDLDLPLTPEQLEALELEANRAVRGDLPVHTEVTDFEDAASRRLRKRAEKARGEVRIVYIDHGKVDSCTCCGTHLARTGMVGAIRITDSQHYKGGTRLWFACGGRAAKLGIRDRAALGALARRYSTSREELPAVIEKQINELAALKAELKQKSALLAERTAIALLEGAPRAGGTPVICESLASANANDLRLMTDFLAGTGRAYIALLFAPGRDGTDYRMASSGSKLDMKSLCAAVNAAVNGKGGGNKQFAQGRTARAVEPETVKLLFDYIMKAES